MDLIETEKPRASCRLPLAGPHHDPVVSRLEVLRGAAGAL